MVYELKEPRDGSKGVLIFTHKERYIFETNAPIIDDRIRKLRKKYVIGMHWGWYHRDVPAVDLVDFHLAGEDTVHFRDSDVRHIPLCSRNFIPSYFEPLEVPTQWDVVCVATPAKAKNLGDLLDVARTVLDRGVQIRILIWCKVTRPPTELSPGNWDRSFFEKYESMFTESEKELIQLATPLRRPYPVPHEVLPFLYNSSKAFSLFTELEGESRVIHEALLCGTPVIVRSDLKGGGRDYLDAHNSWMFDSLDEVCDIFIDVVNSPAREFDRAPIRQELSEPVTASRLEAEIKKVFEELGEEYQGTIEKQGLSDKLPSHHLTLPVSWRTEFTNDLTSRTAFIRYADWLLERSTSDRDILRLWLESSPALAAELPDKGKKKASSYLRWIDHTFGTSTMETAERLVGE